jgi:hypothetical protein
VNKLARYTIALIVIGAGISGLVFWRMNDPVTAAKTHCESHLEEATGIDHDLGDDTSMHVTGDDRNGIVQVAFLRGGSLHIAKCIIEDSEVTRVLVNDVSAPGP